MEYYKCVSVLYVLAVIFISNSYGEKTFLEASFKAVSSAFSQCQRDDDLSSCLKLRALRFIDRAINLPKIPMTDGLALIKVESEERSATEDNEVSPVDERELPNDLEQRSQYLDQALSSRINRFFNVHQLEFSFPKDVFEGRGRPKRIAPLLIAGALVKAGMMAMAYQAVAMLAGKALLVAKVALVLASVIGLKKLASHGGDEKVRRSFSNPTDHVTYEIIKEHGGGSSGHGGGGDEYGGHYRRFIVEQGRSNKNFQQTTEHGQQMAYRGYPTPAQTH